MPPDWPPHAEPEARRQQALLRAIAEEAHAAAPLEAGLREHGTRAARGLEAYRANAEAIAERALAAAYPTLQALIGADDFARLAREHWHAHPPRRGDLGEWGDALADRLQAHPALAAWPYLADCARLDHALHVCERAADASLDAVSLARLESDDPATLRLELMPGSALIRSAWPIVRIHAAHQLAGDAAERAFAELHEAIAAAQGEDAFVARAGWRGVVHRLDPADARWTAALLAGHDLARALEAAGAGFDFAAWLQAAIRHAWLKGVAEFAD